MVAYQRVEDMEENRFRVIETKRGLGDCSEGLPKDQNPQVISPRLNRSRETGRSRSKRRR